MKIERFRAAKVMIFLMNEKVQSLRLQEKVGGRIIQDST